MERISSARGGTNESVLPTVRKPGETRNHPFDPFLSVDLIRSDPLPIGPDRCQPPRDAVRREPAPRFGAVLPFQQVVQRAPRYLCPRLHVFQPPLFAVAMATSA